MPGYMLGEASDGSGTKAVKIDADVGGIVVTDHVHHEVHEGEMFVSSFTVPHGSEIGNDKSQDFLIVTAAKEAHIFFEVTTGGDAEVLFYEDATTSNDGTGLAELNMNRRSTETAVETVFHTPTVSTTGTLLIHSFVAGGSGPQSSGGASRSDTEWILDTNSKYLLRVTNRSGSAIQLSAVFEWYSETA